ncbi:phosphonate ABC transporter, permease protein PhnE [Pseudogemmobacter bohemicus]|uniref:phosphonate ABC transporter, permease protein PhnE n=1 Tax=Pseudogemmobacter bohemicus TaxID=2250708 RepID=UPI000DD3574B|nr:phosphonate ABC transporter, permease protein PhnE [Pseudogemmobacter bohemicus]
MSAPRDYEGIRRSAFGSFVTWAVVAAVLIWAAADPELELSRLAESGPRIVEFLGRMVPPDLSVLSVAWASTAETLRIAILGTVGCIVLSIGFGILGAQNLTPAWVHVPVKALLAVIRGIPLILVAMLMVGAVGLGALPGILAIAFHATGMLAKFYSEAIESIAPEPVEALESAGASFVQRMRFGAWPQIAPDILRDTLFRFEMNLRESLILGIVGAGGIGFYIQTYVRSFQYDKVATLALVVIAIIVMIELVNNALRRRLR